MSNLEFIKTYGLIANPLNDKLISELKKNGGEVLIFPSVGTEKVEKSERSARILTNLTDFDWIVLTDIFAADYFIEALRENETDFFELDELTVCALGEAVADRLRFVRVHADVIPSKINDTAVFSAILQFTGEGLQNLRLLVAREESAEFPFIEMLGAEKASVEELAVYKARLQDFPDLIKLKTLLQGGAVDEFVFSSAGDLQSLKLMFQEDDLAEILCEIKVSATSEIIYQTLQENDLRPLYFHQN